MKEMHPAPKIILSRARFINKSKHLSTKLFLDFSVQRWTLSKRFRSDRVQSLWPRLLFSSWSGSNSLLSGECFLVLSSCFVSAVRIDDPGHTDSSVCPSSADQFSTREQGGVLASRAHWVLC
jgi:hypothetical protein